ncbi:hypothetical protein R1479_04405 [Ralstonia mannitolilytica]|uniref:Uncharacterized protein n=1 Tax=Ralstonia mannitolilytica TaxID=105219 RepID=A0ABN9KHG1_9RALS|nr:DUF6441 family protein [Ralstonia mannitolilytica]CAJ0888369.1 hypothetical protein R77569_03882 [Ralstonia mannitolilytica]CAJ0899714.1 hypothetical protein R1479_04405 [Ralstonia mannitolilytica]
MRLSLTTTGLLDPRQLAAWSTERRRVIHAAVAKGMQSGGREVRDAARSEMHSAFTVKRASFIASMGIKVFDKKTDELPALWVGSRIPWLGIHTQGGTVSGNLLIPLLPGRIGPKRFKAVIDGLMRSGNAFFVEKNGRVLLMAENIQENASQVGRFKRAERGRTGAKQIKRGQEIPIATLVRRVDLKRRLNLAGGVQRALPALARAIQQELDKV